MSFADLGVSPDLLDAVAKLGLCSPTPIQKASIPLLLSGKDAVATAQTGTGKTASFALPVLQRLSSGGPAQAGEIRALVLTPTRELAIQVGASLQSFAQFLPLSVSVIHGGVKFGPQLRRLASGADVLVATPGRLLDCHRQGAVDFSALEILVFDEADRMLDLGFLPDIKRIAEYLPGRRQTLMFSATFSDDLQSLAATFLRDPVRVRVSEPNAATEHVRQLVYPVDQGAKADLLIHLINLGEWSRVLVFTRTRDGADRLCKKLAHAGIEAAAIHSNRDQSEREQTLLDFKATRIQALVATDIAARGLDIERLPQVVNFDLPAVPEDYVHRIGRAGRAGAPGTSHSFVSAREAEFLDAIQSLLGTKIPKKLIDGFGAATAFAALETRRAKKPRPAMTTAPAREAAVAVKPKRRRLRPAGAVGGLGKKTTR